MDVDGKFSRYLIASGLVEEAIVQRARAFQADHAFLRIGEILTQTQALSFPELLAALQGYRAQCKLGQLLVLEGIITHSQLEMALARQGKVGGLLGEILVQLGSCTDEQVTEALAIQKKPLQAGA
ncbi:MAG TPA: hypothetical protein V6D00_11525 [Pantanalinema sp.]